MTKWEYHRESLPYPITLDALNKFGAEGWEVYGVEDGWEYDADREEYVFDYPAGRSIWQRIGLGKPVARELRATGRIRADLTGHPVKVYQFKRPKVSE